MRLLVLAALLAATSAAPALASERDFPTGGNFTAVSNSTPFDVYIHTGQAARVHASGNDKAVERLQIENRGGELRIGTKPGSWFSGWNWSGGTRLRIDVSVPMIGEIRLSGPANITVDTIRTRDFGVHVSGPGDVHVGTVEARGITLDLSGPGDIYIAGRAERGVLRVAGPGDIHADKLTLTEASASVSGPGNIAAVVTGTADVSVSGPGDVRITGGARCNIRKSGPGDARCD